MYNLLIEKIFVNSNRSFGGFDVKDEIDYFYNISTRV